MWYIILVQNSKVLHFWNYYFLCLQLAVLHSTIVNFGLWRIQNIILHYSVAFFNKIVFSACVFLWQECSIFQILMKRKPRGTNDNSVLEIIAQWPWVSNIRSIFSVCHRQWWRLHLISKLYTPPLAKKSIDCSKRVKYWTSYLHG